MINLGMLFRIALRSIKANKLRSMLTGLGIIIGICSVIIMLAIGNGAQQSLKQQLDTLGSNLLIIHSGISNERGVRSGRGSMPSMKKADGDSIAEKIKGVKAVAPILLESSQIVYGNQNWLTTIVGTTNDNFKIKNWGLSGGRDFFKEDIKNASKVVILGQTVVNELFGDVDPIGKTVRIKNHPFLVIGTLEPLGGNTFGEDHDSQVFIPITTAQKKVMGIRFPDQIRFLMVQAQNLEATYLLPEEIKILLRQRHNLGKFKDDDFVIENLTQIMEKMKNSSKIMTILLGSIASISLLVGGIGIMNIMLVSVTERTREIGIRMAIGAKVWDIRWQFLIEALVISLISGLIGIALGLVGCELISQISPFRAVATLHYVLLPFLFSGAIGLFFGFYPAYKASLLNPITALHNE